MAKTINTLTTNPESLTGWPRQWIYNGFDCCLTWEIWEKQQAALKSRPAARATLDFELALQAPALEMMQEGLKVDEAVRQQLTFDFEAKEAKALQVLNRLADAVWGRDLNPNSPKQVQEFFYGAMKLAKIYSFKKGERKVSTDRDALEKLKMYPHARPFVNSILFIRDCHKTLTVLRSGVSADGRLRASFHVAGTETGRWASSKNAGCY